MDIAFEVVEQAIDGGEDIGFLIATDMPMITFASLVVVPDALLALRTVEKAVLEAVDARWHRLGKLPYDDLDDSPVVAYFLGVREQRGLHVLHSSNT